MARLTPAWSSIFLAMLALFLCLSTTLAVFAQEEFDGLHVLPIAQGSTIATISGYVSCETACKAGDKVEIVFAPGQTTLSLVSAKVQLVNIGKQISIGELAFGAKKGSTTINFEMPTEMETTPTIQYIVGYTFEINKQTDPKAVLFPFNYSSSVQSSYKSKPADPATEWPTQIYNTTFKVISANLVPTLSQEKFVVSLYDPTGGHLPTDLAITIEDVVISEAEVIYLSIHGQEQFSLNADLSQATFVVNGVDCSKHSILIASPLVHPFADPIPTLVIDYAAAATAAGLGHITLLANTNVQINAHFGPNVLPSHDTDLGSYLSIAFQNSVNPESGQYSIANIEFTPFSVVGVPELQSTIISDGNYLYQHVDITYSVPTSIKDVEYSLAARGVRPQFSYIYLHNTTWIERHDGDEDVIRELLQSTLQIDKVWYNTHTARTSVHDFQPMFESSEFVSTTYSVLIVTPSSAPDSAVGQFTLHFTRKTDTSVTTIPITTIATVKKALTGITTYPQFDVQTQEKDKVEPSLFQTEIKSTSRLHNGKVEITQPLADDVTLTLSSLSAQEQAWTGIRDVSDPLKFTADFRNIKKPIESAQLTFHNHQFVFVGDFTTGCTINGKSVDSVTTIPLVDHSNLYTSIIIKGAVAELGHYELTCTKGFILHRETYQTSDILNSFFPLQILGMQAGVVTSGSTVMFHYPHHSMKNDITFIVFCLVLGLIFIPTSQLFLCWVHPSKDQSQVDADENLINTGLLAVQDEEDDGSVVQQDRFTRPMHSVHRRLNMVTQSEDPHH